MMMNCLPIKMKKNKKFLERLDKVYGELEKAERQLRRQTKQMGLGKQRILDDYMRRAKYSVKNLYWGYDFLFDRKD